MTEHGNCVKDVNYKSNDEQNPWIARPNVCALHIAYHFLTDRRPKWNWGISFETFYYEHRNEHNSEWKWETFSSHCMALSIISGSMVWLANYSFVVESLINRSFNIHWTHYFWMRLMRIFSSRVWIKRPNNFPLFNRYWNFQLSNIAEDGSGLAEVF